MTIKYDKLVRDHIPEKIKAEGKTPVTRILSDEEYTRYLNRKLVEEVNEYLENNCLEEICDVLEVIEAIVDTMNIDYETVTKVKEEKAIKNGKFERKILLEEVIIK